MHEPDELFTMAGDADVVDTATGPALTPRLRMDFLASEYNVNRVSLTLRRALRARALCLSLPLSLSLSLSLSLCLSLSVSVSVSLQVPLSPRCSSRHTIAVAVAVVGLCQRMTMFLGEVLPQYESWRGVVDDGNGFYRALFIGHLEQCIQTPDVKALTKLCRRQVVAATHRFVRISIAHPPTHAHTHARTHSLTCHPCTHTCMCTRSLYASRESEGLALWLHDRCLEPLQRRPSRVSRMLRAMDRGLAKPENDAVRRSHSACVRAQLCLCLLLLLLLLLLWWWWWWLWWWCVDAGAESRSRTCVGSTSHISLRCCCFIGCRRSYGSCGA
jgi:hypothetical protein